MPSEMMLAEGTYGLRASLQSEWTPDTAAYLAKRDVVELELNMAKGWRAGTDLSFLSEVPFLRSFEIFDFLIKDISPIHVLGNLRRLGITTYCSTAIDFSKFPHLESCGLEWRPKAASLFASTTLKYLFINRYKGRDTESFSTLVNLESLKLLNSPVTNLHGFRTLKKIRTLRLANLRKLLSLEGIEGLISLEELIVDTCRGISTISELGALTNLRFINLDNDDAIESLKPLRTLDNLERVGFTMSTEIVDGDMTVLLGLKNLKMVGFRNRKHYTHTREELDAILAKRHGTQK